jgi:hypothetical protein
MSLENTNSGNIRSREAIAKSLWDFSIFNGCFPREKIRLSDIDGIVDIGGKFLIIEGKGKYDIVRGGQKILLDRLSKVKEFTILVIYGDPKESTIDFYSIPPSETKHSTTTEKVVSAVRNWAFHGSFAGCSQPTKQEG